MNEEDAAQTVAGEEEEEECGIAPAETALDASSDAQAGSEPISETATTQTKPPTGKSSFFSKMQSFGAKAIQGVKTVGVQRQVSCAFSRLS
jgi:hypothetical protein